MNDTLSAGGKAPAHLWVLGVLSLLWNCYGAYDYIMNHTGDAQSLGVDAATFAWFLAFPAWVTAGWAIGVWVSLAGSVLLLFRSRHAQTAFLVSLVGTLASFAYQFTSDRPAELQSGVAMIMPLVIVIVIVAQWYYARRMTAAGVLR
jgi:hypothetical protein